MIHYCTHCDYNYLLKGLALYHNLLDHSKEEFMLHWLCNDSKTAEKLSSLNLPNIKIYTLDELERQDESLKKAKDNPPSKYGTQHSQYMWCLTPYFIWHLLSKQIVPKDSLLTYLDSDIQFYDNPKCIHDKIGDASIGIHTHRFSKWIEDSPVGNYNVGVVVFRNNYPGTKVATQWKDWMLKTDHQYYEKYGTCGDQKYLELFVSLVMRSDICIFDKESPFSHRAPWCVDDDGKPMLFYHFSHFVHNLQNNTWQDHINAIPEWRPSQQADILPYYEKYFELIKRINEKYKIE